MSAESLGGGWGNQYLSEDDEIWQRMAAQFKDQMGNLGGQNEAAVDAGSENVDVDNSEPVAEDVVAAAEEPERVEAEEIKVEVPSQGDGVVSVEQHRENLEARLAAENEARMKQSEEEMGAFGRKLEMSPEAYWQELKNEYALEGVNLGLMPDVRGMREDVAGFLTENFGEGDQTERIGVAIKTELDKMARSKAEEIRKWQSEGRGLPITFESEWVEAGQRDMKNILNEYYGAEGDFGKQAKNGGELADEEKVAWQMASLEQKPGTLNPVWTVKSYAGMFGGETVPEYYNRLKNYRKQDQMREWQIQQDQGKQVIDREEIEAEGAAEEVVEEPVETSEEQKAKEVEEAIRETDAEVEARKQQEIEEAIRITDEEIAKMRDERETGVHREMVEKVVRRRGLRGAIGRLMRRFLDMMKLEDTTEEDEAYYDEMERQEQEQQRKRERQGAQGEWETWEPESAEQEVGEQVEQETYEAPEGRREQGFDAELWAATDRSGLPPVFEDEGVTDIAEEAEQEGQKEVTDDVEGAVRNLTPRRVQELIKTVKEAEGLLARTDLSEETRASLEETYRRLTAIWERYQEVEWEKGRLGELAFNSLVRKGLISEEAVEASANELETLKRGTERGLSEAAWNDDTNALNEYVERMRMIRQAMEWLGVEPKEARGVDVIPVERPQGEVVGGVEPEATGAVA